MKNFAAIAFVILVLSLLFAACTPEELLNEQSEVDKEKIERPGSQGGN